MKNNFPTALILAFGLMTSTSGCGKKTDAATELQNAATALATAAPVPAQPPAPSQPPPKREAATTSAQQMRQASTAYKSGELTDAVTSLHKLRATGVLSPEQRIVVNDAMAAMMTDIYSRAAKGDPRAIQAVKQYEQMQTTRL